MIRFDYPDFMIKKIQAIFDEAMQAIPPKWRKIGGPVGKTDDNHKMRYARIKEKTGLGRDYLHQVLQGKHTQPSGRVVLNLGYEMYLKDLATGEFHKVEINAAQDIFHK